MKALKKSTNNLKKMNTILKKRIEEKSKELAQRYFPNEMNIWARPNYEAQYMESACKEITTFALQNQWISVEEALPEFQQSVVVTNSEGDYWAAWRSKDNCEHSDDNGFLNYGIGEITHWMQIPQLKGGEK